MKEDIMVWFWYTGKLAHQVMTSLHSGLSFMIQIEPGNKLSSAGNIVYSKFLCSYNLYRLFLQSTSDISGLAKEIVSSLLDEDADSELEDLPRLTEDDILVDVSLATVCVFSFFLVHVNCPCRGLHGFYILTIAMHCHGQDGKKDLCFQLKEKLFADLSLERFSCHQG